MQYCLIGHSSFSSEHVKKKKTTLNETNKTTNKTTGEVSLPFSTTHQNNKIMRQENTEKGLFISTKYSLSKKCNKFYHMLIYITLSDTPKMRRSFVQ